jgi:2-polyprenyl-3-methyl-5-hydroxy-6-metoxy-1,4-benzoquinol methylase
MKRLLKDFLQKKTTVNIDTIDEHFIPSYGLDLDKYIHKGDLSGVHHLIRYLWAQKVIADLSVDNILDIACGSGYGSYLIAKEFPKISVTGCDYDHEAIRYAGKEYSLPNLEYKFGDGVRWKETIGSRIFDCIISFDTIEHVMHREILMQNFVEHLHEKGALLFSTPCAQIGTIVQPEWVHHKIEYSAESLYDFLKRYFHCILKPDDNTLPHLDIFTRLNENAGIIYYLKMNPLVCKKPITIENPYRES